MAASEGLSVICCRTPEELQAWRQLWLEKQWHPNADLDFYLLIQELWKQTSEILTLVVLENGQPILLCAGRIHSSKQVFRLGYFRLPGIPVRRWSIITGGLMGRMDAPVIQKLLLKIEDLLKEERLDYATLCDIRVDSELYRRALDQTPFSRRDHVAESRKHWRLTLPSTFDEFLKQRRKSQRQWIKRMCRPLEKDFAGKFQVRVFTTEADLDTFVKDAEEIAKLTYHRRLGVGFVGDDLHRKRCLLNIRRGAFHGFILYIEDRPQAFWAGTTYGDCIHLAWTAYNPKWHEYEVGTVLFLRMLERLCQLGIKEVDFGLGDAPYKARFCDQSWDEGNVAIYAPTFRGLLLNGLTSAIGLLSRAAKAVLNSLGVIGRLKTLWRRRLNSTEASEDSAST